MKWRNSVIQRNVPFIFALLFRALEEYGAIKWHTSLNGSMYLKFKDCRLGSIRISDHLSRQRYSYKYDINVKDTTEQELDYIYNSIMQQANSLSGFNPKIFLIYDKYLCQYVEVYSLETYRNKILKKD